MGKPEGKRPIGRPRHRWEDNIKVDFSRKWNGGIWIEVEWGYLDWIELAQVRDSWRALMNAVMNLRVP